MTIQLIESWKTYAATANIIRRWPYQFGGGGKLVAAGCQLGPGSVNYCNTHIHPLNRLHFGFWFTPLTAQPGVTNSSCVHTLCAGEPNSYNQIGLGYYGPTGIMEVFSGPNFSGLGGTTLANGTTALALNTTHWLELDIVYRTDATGTVELRIDGTTEISLTGIITAPQGRAYVDRLAIVGGDAASYIWGGLYIGDGVEGWTGPCNVEYLALTADTAQKDFTPSTGSTNYTLLNDLDAAGTYVSSSNLSATDLYTITAPSYTPASIKAVQVLAEAVQTDSANKIKAVTGVLKTGTSSAGTGAVVPQATFPLVWQSETRGILYNAPNGSPWTYANLSAALAGMRVAPFAKGFNFRGTSGYLTDPPYSTYVLGDLYPTTRGGVTFGWDGAVGAHNCIATYDYFGGANYQANNGTQRTFRVDVPGAGRYQIRLVIGDYTGADPGRQRYVQVKDGTTPLFTIDTTIGNPYGPVSLLNGLDASGNNVDYPLTSWPEWNTPLEIVLTGSVLNITIGSLSAGLDYTAIAHLEVVAMDEVDALASVAPPVNVAGLYVEALMSTDVAPTPITAPQVAVFY